MGHLIGDKTSLIPLIDRLNKYPVGLVDNETLRSLLALLFTETEAFVGSRFPLREATLDELTRYTKMDKLQLQPVLTSMADKGLIMDLAYGDETYYLLLPGLIGFFEFTFMKRRTDLPLEEVARLMDEYFKETGAGSQAEEVFGSNTQLTRALVYDDTLPVSSEIVSLDSARSIVTESRGGAASLCYCRHKRQHEGKSCKKGVPVEGLCISLGRGSEFLVRRGFATPKTKDELLDILEQAETLHLTHVTDNIRHKPTFICNCCGCCCEIMAGVKAGYYKGVNKTPWLAQVNQDLCEYCGDCFTACNIRAIGLDKEASREASRRVCSVNTASCLGCGACISACTKNALSLVPRDDYVLPPKTRRGMFMKIAREKGRLGPLLTAQVKKKLGIA